MKLISVALMTAFLLVGCNSDTKPKEEKAAAASSSSSSSADAIFGNLKTDRLK